MNIWRTIAVGLGGLALAGGGWMAVRFHLGRGRAIRRQPAAPGVRRGVVRERSPEQRVCRDAGGLGTLRLGVPLRPLGAGEQRG